MIKITDALLHEVHKLDCVRECHSCGVLQHKDEGSSRYYESDGEYLYICNVCNETYYLGEEADDGAGN